MYFIILFLFVVIYFTIGKLRINILNPTLLYIVVWGSMILMYQLPLFYNFPQLSVKSWLVLTTSIILFIIGSLTGARISINKKDVNVAYNYNNMQIMVDILFILFVGAFGLTIMILGLPPVLGGAVPRVDYYVSGIEIVYLLLFPFWFMNIYLIIKKHRRTFNLFILGGSILITLLKGNKFPIIFLIMLIIFFVSLTKKVTIKNVILALVVVIVIFTLSSYYIVRSTQAVVSAQNVQLGLNIPSYLNFLVDPILYLTNNLMNLNNFLNVDPILTFGTKQLSGVLHDTGLLSLFEDSLNSNEVLWNRNLQYSWLTTGTYLKSLYLDFGVIGVLFEPILYGILSGYFYNKLIQKRMNASIITIYIYFLFFFFIAISFFTNYFEGNELLVDILAIVVINKVCLMKNNSSEKVVASNEV